MATSTGYIHNVSAKYMFYILAQEVDGETLISLGACATMEQLSSCGLRTVKQQLALKRMVLSLTTHDQPKDLARNVVKEEKEKLGNLLEHR